MSRTSISSYLQPQPPPRAATRRSPRPAARPAPPGPDGCRDAPPAGRCRACSASGSPFGVRRHPGAVGDAHPLRAAGVEHAAPSRRRPRRCRSHRPPPPAGWPRRPRPAPRRPRSTRTGAAPSRVQPAEAASSSSTARSISARPVKASHMSAAPRASPASSASSSLDRDPEERLQLGERDRQAAAPRR